jgi:hypothetical protein
VAVTLGWTELICRLPCGAEAALMQRPVLVSSRTAVPSAVTRVAGPCHRTVVHGLGVFPIINEQPAIVVVSVATSAGDPLIVTALWLAVKEACPPCGQLATVAVVRTFPGMSAHL